MMSRRMMTRRLDPRDYRRTDRPEVTAHDWQPHKDGPMKVCKTCHVIRLCTEPDYTYGCLAVKEKML
jgi:hypothetical protein